MRSTIASLNFPIVFVMDRECDQMIPVEIDDDAITAFDDTSIAIRARMYVDGDVEIICDGIPGEAIIDNGKLVLCKQIKTKSGVLSVISAEDDVLVECACRIPEATICVIVDDDTHPGKIWIMTAL